MKRWTIRKTTAIPVALVAAIAVFAAIGVLSDDGGTAKRSPGRTAPQRVASDGSPLLAVAGGIDASGAPAKTGAGAAGSSGGDLSMSYDFANLGPDRSRSLVRNGQLSLTVDKGSVPGTVARIIGLTDSMGGYIVSTYMGTTGPEQPYPMGQPADGSPYATITVRVPARNFDEAVTRLSRLGSVEQLTTSSDDVTGQMIDLRARLRHYNAVEARLLGFLEQTRTISETLRVQDRIDEAQLQIEQLEGQLNALDETVSYSMLSVSVTENDAVVAAAKKAGAGFGGRFMHSLRLIGRGAQVSWIALGALLPFAVLIVMVGAILVVGSRSHGRRHPRVTPPAPPAPQALQS